MSKLFPTFTVLARWLSEAPARLRLTLRLLAWGPTSLRFDPLVALRELASMLRSGIPLPQALRFLTDSFSGSMRSRLEAVRARVEAGEPLSEALAALPPRLIPASLRATVAAGERCGQLPEVLEEVVNEYERLNAFDRRVRSFALYPTVVLLITCAVLWVVGSQVLPMIATLYEGFEALLPWTTVFVFSVWIPLSGWLVLILVAALVHQLLGFYRPVRLGPVTQLGRLIAWKMPVVRGLRQALIEVRFARTLRLLLDAGVPLPESLDHCQQVVADDASGVLIVDAARRVRDGEQPSHALRGLDFLSPAFIWFLTDSERRGDFLDVTRALAETAEERFLTRMEVLERVLEPVTTLALGIVVGAVIVAIYQPMFNLVKLVGP